MPLSARLWWPRSSRSCAKDYPKNLRYDNRHVEKGEDGYGPREFAYLGREIEHALRMFFCIPSPDFLPYEIQARGGVLGHLVVFFD